jgi:hypothetical protein
LINPLGTTYLKIALKTVKSPVTTAFKAPVRGIRTASAVFSHQIWVDTQEIAKTPQFERHSVFARHRGEQDRKQALC